MASETLEGLYVARLELLSELAVALERETARHLATTAHIDRVSFRVKTPRSFISKVTERKAGKYSSPLEEVEDQVAGRVIVFFKDEVELVRERLSELFGAVEEAKREPEDAWEFSYESFHAIVLIPRALLPEGWRTVDAPPKTFELQIRTLFQHAFAESTHDLIYKPPTELQREELRRVAWIAASAWGADETLVDVKKAVLSRA